MEYTYQPGAATRSGRGFARLRISRSKKIGEMSPASNAPIREVVLGQSLLARVGYWLLMRSARVTNSAHIAVRDVKKTKVTRSVLRQNKKPEDLLSIVATNGRRNVVRIADTKLDTGIRKTVGNASGKKKPVAVKDNALSCGLPLPNAFKKNAQSGLGVSQINSTSKRNANHPVKNIEQDLFVKTERNIAAAMKEARKGISAEQLVIRFGLSVPEAGLIASMHK